MDIQWIQMNLKRSLIIKLNTWIDKSLSTADKCFSLADKSFITADKCFSLADLYHHLCCEKSKEKKIAMNRINNKCHIICTRIEVNILWCVHIIYVHHSVTLTRIIDSFDCHSMIKTYTQSQHVYKRSERKKDDRKSSSRCKW